MQLVSVAPGWRYYPELLDAAAQDALLADLREVVRRAPLFQPTMPRTGTPFSVRMTNCGSLGWVSDKERGYRYQATHPETGENWPHMPPVLTDLWQKLAEYPHPAEACLVNYYTTGTKMGLHQDRDEADFAAPVLSVSLGDEALFRIGGLKRNDPTRSLRLRSGDVILFEGEARLAFHGIDRIYPGTSTRLKDGGRINLTMRRVTKPD